MKIAVPTYNGKLCMHFGHCESFTIVDIDESSKKVIGLQSLIPPEHAPGVYPKWVADQGVTLVIAGGMGSRAQQLFLENGVKVIVGAPAKTPEEVALDYINDRLQQGINACDH